MREQSEARCGRARPGTGGRRASLLLLNTTFEWRVRRIAREIFVGINADPGMIDGEQLHLVEVHRIFQRLHEGGNSAAIFFSSAVRPSLIDSVGRAMLRRLCLHSPPSSVHDTRAEHVADKLVFGAIPGEKRGTGTAAADPSQKGLRHYWRRPRFILQHAGRHVMRTTSATFACPSPMVR